MKFEISNGLIEKGTVVGNTFNKYGSCNPIIRWMMNRFEASLSDLVAQASPETIHEIGCGEGYWVLHWNEQGICARGSDFSTQVIKIANENTLKKNIQPTLFNVRSIYELKPESDSADLIVCCEVLEHLFFPEKALSSLQQITKHNIIISVPREPLWHILNISRGKYLLNLGNTPGHIQHWSPRGIVKLVSKYFKIIEISTPLPWVMLLCTPLHRDKKTCT